jgi:hypothetical protein
VLAVAGGLAGLAVASAALSAASAFELPFGFDVGALHAGLNARVVAFSAAVTLLAGGLAGVLPAFEGRRGVRLQSSAVLAAMADRAPAGYAGGWSRSRWRCAPSSSRERGCSSARFRTDCGSTSASRWTASRW